MRMVTEKKRQAIVEAVANGASYTAASLALGVSHYTARVVALDAGVRSTHKGVPVDRERVDAVRQLVADGHPYSDIGKRLGMSRSAVAGLCKRNGIRRVGAATSKVKAPRRPRAVVAPTERRPARQVVRKPIDKPSSGVTPSSTIIAFDPTTAIAFPTAGQRDVCMWPLWTDETPVEEHRVCGGIVHRGWACAFHARLAYRFPTERRAA